MGTIRQWALLTATATLATSCAIYSYTWNAPATVAAGAVFAMDVTGVSDYGYGPAWAVFQVPIGFEVLGAGYVATPGSVFNTAIVTNDAASHAPYVASPGHQLVSVSGWTPIAKSFITVDAKVYVRAPTVPGTYTLRMALAVGTAGALQPQLGLTGFQTPNGSTARTVQVQAVPPDKPFAIASEGLWDQPRPLDAVAGDADRDGLPDLVMLNSTELRVFRASAGGFTLATTMPLGTSLPYARVAASDLDGDGWLDIVVSNGQVFFGTGPMQWVPGLQLPPVINPNFGAIEVKVGDFDGDGNRDVTFTGNASTAVFHGLGGRAFAAPMLLATQTGATPWVLVDDLDGDGRSELLTGMRSTSTPTMLWRHNPGWALITTLPAARGAVAIDGGPSGKTVVLDGAGLHYRWNGQSVSTQPAPQVLAFDRAVTADFDRDGFVDVLGQNTSLTNPLAATMMAWRANGSGQFTPINLPMVAGFRALGPNNSLLAADFDGDTWPDAFAAMDRPLVWHNTNTGAGAYGSGCGGAASVPLLQATGTVAAGQAIALQLSSGLPSAVSVFWAGNSSSSLAGLHVLPLPLAPFGAPGCFLLAEQLEVIGMIADNAGIATLPVLLPSLPSTLQMTAFSQAAVLDLGANALGGRFSGGLALKLQ